MSDIAERLDAVVNWVERNQWIINLAVTLAVFSVALAVWL